MKTFKSGSSIRRGAKYVAAARFCAMLALGCNASRQDIRGVDEDSAELIDSWDNGGDTLNAEEDARLEDTEYDVSHEFDGDSLELPSNAEDAAESDLAGPFDCSMVSIICRSSTGARLMEGDSIGTSMTERSPLCELAVVGGTSLPRNVVWSSSISGLPVESLTVGIREEYEVPAVVPGELVIRGAADFGELGCEPELRLNVVPPNGFFAVVTWDDGYEPGPPVVENTDIDTHLVRGDFCFRDPLNDLYFATRGAGLDWGVPDYRPDNPRLTYDSRMSPGFESAWIDVPDESETVLMGVHGFGIRALVGDSPVNVDYSVYIGGMLVAEGTVPITKGEYAAVGALRAGEWLPATVETRPDGLVCPVLSTPAP